MLSLGATAEQEAFSTAIDTLARRHDLRPAVPSRELWLALGGVGLLGIGSPQVGGSAADLVAGIRAAGSAGVRGPFLGAVMAARADDADVAAAAAAGTTRVGVVGGGVAAWGGGADLLLEIADGAIWEVEPDGAPEPMTTLAGEPWARGTFRRARRLGAAPVATVAAVDLARAAWVVGAGATLLELGADHARERRQFGRAIGDFQAVAHPLAAAAAEVGAAGDLVRLAAWRLDHDGDHALVGAARSAAARAALQAAYTSHQVHGALGFTVERGLDRWSTGVRQLTLHPPVADPGSGR